MNSGFGDDLKDYEATIEGARAYLKDHENDEKMQTFLKSIKEDWKVGDKDPQKKLESLILYFIKMQKDMHKFWPKDNFDKIKNNFFKLTLNEFDLKLINNIFSRKEERPSSLQEEDKIKK